MSTVIKLSTFQAYRNDRQGLNVTGDCAVRAFATFMDCSYQTAREWINKWNMGRDAINGSNVFGVEKALTEYGKTRGIKVTKHTMARNAVKVKTVVANQPKAYISARGHATACINGVHYSNLTQEEADSKKYRDDANQFVRHYYTMEVEDINLYLSGGCV